MIRAYCDICGKMMKNDCSDMVNLDFNAYFVSGFEKREKNLCVPCAERIVSIIDELGKHRGAAVVYPSGNGCVGQGREQNRELQGNG